MVDVWNALPVLMVEADMIVVFQRVLDRHVDMQGMRDLDCEQAEEFSLTWHRVQH